MRKRARWVPVGQIEYAACFKLEKSAGFTYPSGWLPANVKMASFVIDEGPGFWGGPYGTKAAHLLWVDHVVSHPGPRRDGRRVREPDLSEGSSAPLFWGLWGGVKERSGKIAA